MNSELSGNGGNAGRAGFGGHGGFAGEIIVKESGKQKWVRCVKKENKNENESKPETTSGELTLECSDQLKPLVLDADPKRIHFRQGNTARNGKIENVLGGQAGEAGTYGSDHVIYVSGPFSKRVNTTGDYSNYLRETSYCKDGQVLFEESKCKPEAINKKPELYTKRSTGFTLLGIGAIFAAAVGACFLWPVVAAAAATIPAIGVTAWGAGIVDVGASGVAGAAAVAGIAASAAAVVTGAISSFRTAWGDIIEVLDGKKIKKENLQTNRIEVTHFIIILFFNFNNSYNRFK